MKLLRMGLPLFAIVLAFAGELSAHALGQSYVFFRVEDEHVSGRFEITLADLNTALGLELKEDHTATMEEVEPYVAQIRDYVVGRISITSAEGPRALEFAPPRLFATDFAQYFVLDFELDSFASPPEFLDMRFSVMHDVAPNHQNFVVIENEWRSGTLDAEANLVLVFEAGDGEQRLPFASSVWRGIGLMIGLGVHHIWIGIDHILFLVALLLPAVLQRVPPSTRWEPASGFRPAIMNVVKVVTLFTIAHSVTLSLAALGLVSLSSRLVESVIAFSIAVAALDIIYPVFRGRVWLVVFGFGLFHGFGFASVLGEMAIPGKFLALSLFGFNVGVELGQVAVIALVFPVLFLARRGKGYAFPVVQLAALGLIAISLYWFTERAFEVDLPLGAIVQDTLGLR